MTTPDPLMLAVELLALAVPVVLATAAIGANGRSAVFASGTSWVLTLLVTLGTLVIAPASGRQLPGLRIDAVTCVMLTLVCSLGFVITRYSRTYLEGEAALSKYLRWLMLTLSAVTVLVIANDLLVMSIAWTATGLALHRLLTFYSDRTYALVAAHKKFLLSRLADVCVLACLALVHLNVGSLNLDAIAGWSGSHPDLNPSMQAAAVLLVVAVALKSAQLPFHGWLTQVMEAPTPVSALLHAGVVNIGGLVLIRLAPWIAHAQPAQVLLVTVGLVSAVVSALVMTTRVSVKVALAWSTCAQMGFMLVQCGLGAWHLALLHLVAHSLYKAHAFLTAGTVVDEWRVRSMTTRLPGSSVRRLVIAVLVAFGSVILCLGVAQHVFDVAVEGSERVLAVLVGLSVVPLFSRGRSAGPAAMVATVARAGAVAILYVGWHVLAGRLFTVAPPNPLGWGVVGAAFIAAFVVKMTIEVAPHGALAAAIHPWLFAGLYLDERFTRVTFRLWPPRLQPSRSAAPLEALEARS